MFSPKDRDLERGWPGRIDGDRVVQLAAQTLQAFFTGGGKAREHAVYPLESVRLRPPVLQPPAVRLFDATDSFSFGNPAAIAGPEDEIHRPGAASTLVLEPRLAPVIGAGGQIGGFTVRNDWTAPELEPPKDRDFATSLGPVLVTSDEFEELPLEAVARVNGEERARGTLRDPGFSWSQAVGYATSSTRPQPVVILGGPPPLCGEGTELRSGDAVELEVEGIGVLRNTIS